MTSPTLELQGVIVARLKSFEPLVALQGQRIYDQVPPDPVFPYTSFGPSDELSDDAECISGFEISMQIDVWSRAVGFPEARQIADTVRLALHGNEFNLASNALVFFRHRLTRFIRDPDGLTSHAALTFEAFAEQP